MHHRLLLLVCLLATGLHAAAQQSFTGYYIDNDGDTTAVSFPGYKQWKNNPAQIEVRTAGGQDAVLTPENTREVRIEGYDTYRSRRFTRLTNPYIFYGFSNLSAEDSTQELHGFLLFLASGDGVSLYKYSDPKRENFFIEKGDSLVELKHKIYPNHNQSRIIEDNRFRQQLWAAFLDSRATDEDLQNKLERLQYKEDQLEAFVRGTRNRREKKKKQYPSEIGLMGGVAYNTFSVTSESFSNRSTLADYKSSFGPVIGLTFYEYSQRAFGRNFFLMQLKYYRFKNEGEYSYYSRVGTVTYSGDMLNLALGLGRNFIQTSTLKAYAAVAPYLVYIPASKEQYSGEEPREERSVFSYNLSVQAGVRFGGQLGAWVHYNLLPIDAQQYVYFGNHHRSLQLGVDWRLKRHR